MAIFEVIGDLYNQNLKTDKRFVINQGGTSSGKTYTIMQLFVAISITSPRAVLTIAGQDLPNLKVGAMRDLETIVSRSEYLTEYYERNRSEHTYRGKNGSIIEFKSYSDAQDAKNGKRDYLFVNEANGIPYDIFWQLQIRTRKRVYLDYNPTARFWVHDKLIGRDDTLLIISDHRGNAFLSEEEHAKIESIEDKELWRVYARGMTGMISGLIFTRWDLVDNIPPLNECKVHGYGLDFGFTNDPTSLVDLRLAHGELWIDCPIYEQGLTNPDIARRCIGEGMTRSDLIVADCAEPKSIEELKNLGLNVIPSSKGRNSIVNGIDILRRYPMHITRRSHGLITELRTYKWKVTRNGESTNEPIDAFNHAIDALRYVAQTILAVQRTGTARARLTRVE